ncbi:signal peptidase I [Acidianus manzaensis]|uniref:Signal peptidase I n=1 Tax=Acidianus manzaensis TaxID=282676 RepID=A0A1W6K1X5_9CREN|nr:signal peptidase I [Acidianus manzaensis]ARM76509.1 signal peptidase I [Acidianus manzaensis]
MKKSDIALIVIIVAIYVLFFTNIITTASVEGVSMYPVFQNGALTFYGPPVNISLHDVIIYRSPEYGIYVIHRVVKIDNAHYVTQGVDKITNPVPDNRIGLEPLEGVPSSNVVGKVTEVDGYIISIPYLGYLAIIASHFI